MQEGMAAPAVVMYRAFLAKKEKRRSVQNY
jgi:hypothetical protein